VTAHGGIFSFSHSGRWVTRLAVSGQIESTLYIRAVIQVLAQMFLGRTAVGQKATVEDTRANDGSSAFAAVGFLSHQRLQCAEQQS
jgi:hypothetical protein